MAGRQTNSGTILGILARERAVDQTHARLTDASVIAPKMPLSFRSPG